MANYDAWMQHTTARFRAQPIFDPLRRWFPTANLAADGEVPLTATIEDGCRRCRLGLVCAWWGPCAPLIDNDEVGAFVRAYPDRLVGIASVDLSRPMVGIRELRRAVRELGFRGSTYSALVVEPAPDDRRFYALYASRDTLDSPGLQK